MDTILLVLQDRLPRMDCQIHSKYFPFLILPDSFSKRLNDFSLQLSTGTILSPISYLKITIMTLFLDSLMNLEWYVIFNFNFFNHYKCQRLSYGFAFISSAQCSNSFVCLILIVQYTIKRVCQLHNFPPKNLSLIYWFHL